MTSPTIIKDLFANDVARPIEEVIKVDQTDEEVIKFEIDEYVVTKAIAKHYEQILDDFASTPNRPHEGVGVWVSGFFGSGKSSFAKMLGLAIENRPIVGKPAGERFIKDHTEGMDVDGRGRRLAGHLFRGHVLGSAHGNPGLRDETAIPVSALKPNSAGWSCRLRSGPS